MDKTKALVGYTGFVGSNLASSSNFTGLYNTHNIAEAYNTSYDLLIYAGVRAEKFLANQNPELDKKLIDQAIENIKKIKAKQLVLISTIDVYKEPINVSESTKIDGDNIQAYGLNRLFLENWVQENINRSLIVRLPALYGHNLKKNFIFDMMTITPSMIKADVFHSIKSELPDYVASQYTLNDNGFYKLGNPNSREKKMLKDFFLNYHFNALIFTDSQNRYQFYPLKYLWYHIEIALENKVSLLCLNSEPISAAELYEFIFNRKFVNITGKVPVKYDLRSEYAELYGGKNGYIFDRSFILKDIKDFVTLGE